MNLFFNHKFQAFCYTNFLFLFLLCAFLYSTSWLKIPSQQVSLNLAIQQFTIQSEQNSLNAQETIHSNIKQQENILKKQHKKQISRDKQQSQQSSTVTSDIKKTLTNTTFKNTTEVLSFSTDNHPFLNAVKQAIDSNINYPRQARRMRIQGEVIVEFLWTKQQVLKDLKVNKSSGYTILDEGALRIIQRASLHFPKHSNNVRLQIPILFKLKD